MSSRHMQHDLTSLLLPPWLLLKQPHTLSSRKLTCEGVYVATAAGGASCELSQLPERSLHQHELLFALTAIVKLVGAMR